MKKITYNLPQKSVKKDYIFNMIGSMTNAAVSVILLVVVSHIVGGTVAGVFSIAYSTAQMMYTICVFEMRNIQVTDAKNEFSFSHTVMFRIITVFAMWLFFIVFCAIRGYSGQKLIIITMLTFYMSLLSFSDLFQGNMHLNGYLSIAGKSLAGVVALAAMCFSVTLFVTKNLLISIIPMIAVALLWILLFDIPYNNNFAELKPKFEFKVLKNMFLSALPLFLSSFMHQYIFNSSKYAIDSIMTEVDQSHYGYLSMPIFCINLLSIFVFRPQLVTLSENWISKKIAVFKKMVSKLYVWIIIVTLAALAGGYVLGIPVLEILYGADLSGKKPIFMVLLLAGGFSAACTLTLTLFTTMRKQKLCLYGYVITLIFALIVPEKLVASLGLMGAALSYLCEMVLLFVVMFAFFIFVLKRKERQ